MVLANAYALCLRAFRSHLLYELHFAAGCELIERRMHDVLAAEVQLAAVRGFDESVPLIGEQTRDLAVLRDNVRLDVSAHFAGRVLKLALRRIERVSQRNIHVFIVITVHDDLPAWDPQVDRHAELPALVLVLAEFFDADAAANDA